MSRKRIRQTLGAAAMLVGILLTALYSYGLHLYFVWNDMFSFLGPDRASPAPFILLIAAGLLLTGFGAWLFRSAAR